MPDLMLVFEVLLGLVLLRLYLLVPDSLGPTLVTLLFPGTAEEAAAALDFVREHRKERWVSRASIGAMAATVSPLGQWAIGRGGWVKTVLWPVWLVGAARGTVLGAVVIDQRRQRGGAA